MPAVAPVEPSPHTNPRLSGAFYRPELDVVRFLAFLLVFLHHLYPAEASQYARGGAAKAAAVSGGALGLSMFFALSAYLICELLLRERAQTGTVKIQAFYIRRILRIWPLYFLGLGIALGYAAMHGALLQALPAWEAYALFVGNVYIALHGWETLVPMMPLWSISIEEQFYACWPLIARMCSERAMYIICGIILGLANAWLWFFGHIHASPDGPIWTNTFVQFEMFAAGILVSLTLRGRIPRIGPPWRVLLFVASLALWYVSVYVFHANQEGFAPSSLTLMVGYALIASGCAGWLVAFLGARASAMPRVLVYLGRISYGLYVFHMLGLRVAAHVLKPFMQPNYAAQGGVGLAVTIALAVISYHLFEKRFLRLKKRFTLVQSRVD